MTDRIKAEENEVNVKRLEAIGHMAGGVAHDFNNLFTAINGNLSLAKTNLAGNDSAIKYLKEIEKATSRAVLISQGMLSFSNGGDPVRKTCDLLALVKDTVNQMTSSMPISYVYDLPHDLMAGRCGPFAGQKCSGKHDR